MTVRNGSGYVATKVAYRVNFDDSFQLKVMEDLGVTGVPGD